MLSRRPALLAGLLILGLSAAADSAGGDTPKPADTTPILASYDFERSEPSGPDTFRLFERADGSVDLSTSFRVSGSRSLRLREVPGNGTFTEFLGFFPRLDRGRVFVQFYLMLTDPEEEMNFALAGPRWFLSPERGGHAVWLASRDGALQHRPGGEWRSLLVPRAYTWYFFDWVYDVDRGRYDLTVWGEGLEEAIVELVDQPNLGRVDRSPVAFYSFIGDLADRGNGTYFVDDVLVATDPEVRLKPFVAPGRRRFFVEMMPAGEPPTEEEAEDLLWHARQIARAPDPAVVADPALADRLERAADEAFRRRDLDLAETLYRLLENDPARAGRTLLKIADVQFLRGDLEAERAARESIYGRLELEELRDD